MENKNNGRVTLFTFVIICALTFVLFFQYIIGVKSFYFMHVVSDGVMQFYPNYVELSKALKQSMFGTFSWTKGWGGYVMDTNPFSQLITLFGENHIIYMTGLVTALKVTLTGLCFSLYLKELNVEKITNIIYSIMYAFSIQVIGGGCWANQAELAMILPVFLCALERYKNTKKTGIFLVGTILAVLCLSLYYLITLTGFVLAYAFVVYIMQNDKKIKIKKIYVVFLTCLFLLILILGFTEFKDIFMSYRFKKGLNYLNESFGKTLSLKNFKSIMTAVLRSFSPNILGILGANKYNGGEYGWYIADGSLYCGIFTLIMLPQAFHKTERKRNIIFGIGIAACIVMTIFPPFRLFMAGFGNDEFRLIRMWFLFILMYISFTAFNDIQSGKYGLNKKRLYITSTIYISFLTLGLLMHIYFFYYVSAIAFIIIYDVLIMMCNKKKKNVNCLILLFFVCCEAVVFNYKFVNNKDVIYKNEWAEEGKLYNDGTSEMVDWQNNNDKSLFRTNKNYMSVMLNDASIQNYNGTAYYIGGIGLQDRVDLNVALGLPTMYNFRNYSMGFGGNIYADSLLSVKYAISHSEDYYEYGYELMHKENGLNLYYNSRFIPFSFYYDDYITCEEFDNLSLINRKRNILDVAVIDKKTDKLTKIDKNEIMKFNEDLSWNESVDNYICGEVIHIRPLLEDEVLIIEAVSDEEYNLGLKWAVNGEWKDDNSQYMSIYEENGNAVAEVTNQQGTDYIVFYAYGTNGREVIDRVNISICRSEEYYKSYNERIKEIKNDSPYMKTYSNEKLVFETDSDNERLMFMSIPYDAGFDIYIDGKKVEKYKVDYAFTGVLVPEGTHVVEVRYKSRMPEQYKEAVAIIIIYTLLSLCLITKKKINERRSKEND